MICYIYITPIESLQASLQQFKPTICQKEEFCLYLPQDSFEQIKGCFN